VLTSPPHHSDYELMVVFVFAALMI